MKQKNLLFIFGLFFVSLLSAQVEKNTQIFETISVTSADTLIAANYLNPNFIILDIRSISEYNIKHIENGVELNYYNSDFLSSLDTLIKDKIYLLHCASGGRSGSAFNSMKTMGFTEVYNLSGGINAWQSAGFPVVTSVSPIILSVSDTTVIFTNTEINTIDTIELKLTNYGNDTLKFLNITDLSGTEFTTNFNLHDSLTGLMDYSFNIFYSPTDLLDDSTIFTIETNGGTLQYVLKAHAITTSIVDINTNNITIFPNPSTGIFNIRNKNAKQIEILNLNGQVIKYKKINSENYSFDLSNQKKGVYFVRLTTNNNTFVRKLIIK